MDRHFYIFFGSKSAISISSPSMSKPFVFLRCIGEKGDGTWEKPTNGEGKTVKCVLEEMACIMNVLEKKEKKWSTYHRYKGDGKGILFEMQDDGLLVKIGHYTKKFKAGQFEVFRDLMKHLYVEKIEHATISTIPTKENDSVNVAGKASEPRQKLETKEERLKGLQIEKEPVDLERDYELDLEEIQEIQASPGFNSIGNNKKKQEIKPPIYNSKVNANKKQDNQWIQAFVERETEMAIFTKLSSGKEAWIPKSTLHSSLNESKEQQRILVDNWILKKHKIIAGGEAYE